ncbi:copia protein, partial [Tanacetum coccineum]
MQQPMPNLKDITDHTAAMNTTLALMAKAFKLNYSTPTNNNHRIASKPRNRQIAQPECRESGCSEWSLESRCSECWKSEWGNWGIAHQNGNGNVVAARAEGSANGNNGNQIRCYNCRVLGHLSRNCTVRPRRRDAAYLQTQLLIAQREEAGIQIQAKEFDLMAVAADLDEIEEVNANYILMANLQQASTSGTQTDKAHVYDSDGSAEVQLHDKCYNDEIFNMFTQEEYMEQGGGTVEQHPVTVEETCVYQESSLLNLVAEVEKVNMVNCKIRETKCFEISQEKYDKLERCYQQSVYQEQCLTKKINALHLSSGKQITALNEEISNLNKQLSKEKETVSSLQEGKKRLKYNFKIREFLKMALGYQHPFYLKQAQQKQQSLYNGKVLLEKHDPPAVYDSEETLSFVSQTAKSCEELYFSNTSKTVNVSKSISIPNEEFSDDTTPSVARKFLNE